MRSMISAALLALGMTAAHAQPVRIGFVTNESGIGAASGGPGTVFAARMAVADFGGSVLGRPIQLDDADFALKPDIASALARKWLDEGYDVIADVAMSAAALNIADMSKAAKKIYLATSPLTSDLTTTHCSPYTVHWGADSYVLSEAVPRAVMAAGGNSWYFITVDYTLGQSLERDSIAALTKLGGKSMGASRYPVGTTDYAQYLLAAQASSANVIALATASDMLVNNLKQAHEFGMPTKGQMIVAPLLQQSDIDALGVDSAQGLSSVQQFYWDESDSARAFAERYRAKMGTMPGNQQGDAYAAVTHYLNAVKAAGTTESDAVMAKMKATTADYFGKPATIRADGRLLTAVDVYAVKKPEEMKGKFDIFRKTGSLAAGDVYHPILEACQFK